MNQEDLVIVGSNTNCGKTIITGLLLRYLREQHINAISQKWIQTGNKSFSSDLEKHFKLAKINKEEIKPYLKLLNPYCFKFPGSPHLASSLEHKTIEQTKICKSYFALKEYFELILVESAGGVLVPYNKNKFIIDIAKKLSLIALVVIDNKLGAINNALLTIETLKKRRIPILGLIFNQTQKNESKIILEDNPKTVQLISKVKVLGCLPFEKDPELLFAAFKSIWSRNIS
ncbi:MAG: dethiobiotin synthase [Candidatus Margulisiibacteriota bacterium]|jgi:dethiobiotin synthetase